MNRTRGIPAVQADSGSAEPIVSANVSANQGRVLGCLVVGVLIYPVLRWLYLGWAGDLTADPAAFLLKSTGIWSLVFLLTAMGLPHLASWLRQPLWLSHRKAFGLGAFAYGVLHILGWAWWECSGLPKSMWIDITQRPFITMGTLAFLPMLLMALTSTRGWQLRLGRGWGWLHRQIYLVGMLAVAHFWLLRLGKNDWLEPAAYAGVLAILVVLRVGRRWWANAGSGASGRGGGNKTGSS